MNGMQRSRVWKNLKQRLGSKGMGCCGAIWSFSTQTITINIEDEEEEAEEEETHLQNHHHHHHHRRHHHHQVNAHLETAASGMNLAAALAAERNLRDAAGPGRGRGRGAGCNAVGPSNNKNAGAVKTLMMLIQETDGGDWVKMKKKEDEVEEGGNDWMCCVCMERNKGAAFIPCGHTFCRVCSRDLWLNRGSCPVCNRSILEILDIF